MEFTVFAANIKDRITNKDIFELCISWAVSKCPYFYF